MSLWGDRAAAIRDQLSDRQCPLEQVMEQHRDVLKACSEHFLWAAVVSSSRQELPVAVGTPQELGVDILWVRGLCAPGKVWGFVPDYAL